MNISEFLQAALLSIFQGLTEFLPVSSSGHLSLLGALFKGNVHSLPFDIFLHMATLFAVVVFFRKKILALFRENKRGILPILVGSVPAGIAGVFFKKQIEALFSGGSLLVLGAAFLVTTALVFISGRKMRKISTLASEAEGVSIKQAVIIGIFQAIAIAPGISRSGATISAAILVGINPETAFVFSFLLSLPAVAGAFFLEASDGMKALKGIDPVILFSSFVLAFASGLAALRWLKAAVTGRSFIFFSYYTALLGALILAFAFLK